MMIKYSPGDESCAGLISGGGEYCHNILFLLVRGQAEGDILLAKKGVSHHQLDKSIIVID